MCQKERCSKKHTNIKVLLCESMFDMKGSRVSFADFGLYVYSRSCMNLLCYELSFCVSWWVFSDAVEWELCRSHSKDGTLVEALSQNKLKTFYSIGLFSKQTFCHNDDTLPSIHLSYHSESARTTPGLWMQKSLILLFTHILFLLCHDKTPMGKTFTLVLLQDHTITMTSSRNPHHTFSPVAPLYTLLEQRHFWHITQ